MKLKKRKTLSRFQKKIWPSVVGNVVIYLISKVVIMFVIFLQIMEIITVKTNQIQEQIESVYDSCMSDQKADSFRELAQQLVMDISGISGISLLKYTDVSEEESGYMDGSKADILESFGKELYDSDQLIIADENELELSTQDVLLRGLTFPLFTNDIDFDEEADEAEDLEEESEDFYLEITEISEEDFDDISDEELLRWESFVESEQVLKKNVLISSPIWIAVPLDGMELFGEKQEDSYLAFRTTLTVYKQEVSMLILGMIMMEILFWIILIWNIVSTVKMVHQQRNLLNALYTDVTSGGHNMLYLEDKAVGILKKAKDNHYALVSIGMDKYSSFCTCYGSAEMEQLIEFLYKDFSQSCSSKELAAATDKAVFAFLLSYQTPEELEQRVLDMVKKAKKARESQNLIFSIGICPVRENQDIANQYHNASVARETIAEDNAKRLQWFDDKMLQEHIWIHKVEHDMERALADHEFEIYLQPKYSTKEEKLEGAEALVRWIHPEEGFVPPGKFIPIFEKNGFILQLDDYMISEVARLQARWISEGKKVVPISVNVSRAHFTRKDLAEHICGLIDRFGVPHHIIELELTESAFFDDKEILIDTVNQLKAAGFEISMDDFGAGYSSLNSLKELPLDVLKLDAEFFRGDDHEGRGDLIVSEAIDLAKKLDMRIVAEGIETREQVDSLAKKDCDLIQGYFFAKPMPVSEFEKRAFGKPLGT